MSYPPPSGAVTMWLAGDTIWVALPPSPGSDRGHTVHLSANEFGIKNLLVILRQRETLRASPKLGFAGAPTQYDLETVARALAKRPKAVTSSLPSLTLDDLELDL